MIVYRELSSLSRDLEVSVKTLYSLSNSISRHYHTVQLPKKDGGVRTLRVPDPLLKHVQRRIAEVLLAQTEISPYATAYHYGASIKKNAAVHTGNEKVLRLDIRQFFDHILFSQVKQKVFPAERYSEPIRVLLTILCFDEETLPQGAPTSPWISNIILKDFDDAVSAYCRSKGIHYSRYCDDMTFSGELDEKELTEFVSEQLKKEGFFLNRKKNRLMKASQRQYTCGLIVNEKVSVPSDTRRKIRQEMYMIQKYGLSSHLEAVHFEGSLEEYLYSLLGRVNFVLSIEKREEFLKYRKALLEMISGNTDTHA
ncbi:MAG: RNA-directed DNA polymerase [Solobacterium sp.]|nr:RNA-directed DNA polymerase [Solobacterium sp.]